MGARFVAGVVGQQRAGDTFGPARLTVLGAVTFAKESLSGDDHTYFAEAGDDPWMSAVRSGRFWSSGSSTPRSRSSESPRHGSSYEPDEGRRRSREARRPQPESEGRSSERWTRSFGGRGTYRTVCVRLCDGYYWPISFATSSSSFDRDAETCERSCSSPARLYSYPNPGGEPEEMTDAKGTPYSKLKTAFLYRNEYVQDCKCKPDPWDQEALDRHRLYALEARQRVRTVQRSYPELRWAGIVLSGFDLRVGIDQAIKDETVEAFGDEVRAEVPRRASVHEAFQLCERLGINMVRAATVGTHPRFIQMIRELVEERMTDSPQHRTLGALGPSPDTCPEDCCKYEPRRS